MGLFLFHLWGYCFLAAGIFCALLGLRNFIKSVASYNWQQTECKILRSYVQVTVEPDRRSRNSMTPTVEYEYQFEGKDYRGSCIRFGQIGTSDRARAEKVLEPFVEGTSVPLYVNAGKPSESTLIPGTYWGSLFLLVAGIVFGLAGYSIIIVKK